MPELMTPEKAFAVLKKYSIPYAQWSIAKNEAQALKAARNIGFPVALKLISKKILHKSDAGAVKTNLCNEKELNQGFGEIVQAAKKLKVRPEGFLVQKMVAGTEIIIGLKKDSQFGPVVLFGLGGIFVEVMKDVAMRIAPLTKNDCLEMVGEIKGSEILKGARGQKPVNIDTLVKILLAVSKIGMKNQNITEMDLNPVLANEKSASVVDVRIIIEK